MFCLGFFLICDNRVNRVCKYKVAGLVHKVCVVYLIRILKRIKNLLKIYLDPFFFIITCQSF